MTNQISTKIKFSDLRDQESKKAYIKRKLATSKLWQAKAVLRLYEFQTEREKAVGDTRFNNNVGFDSKDGKFMSFIARSIISKMRYQKLSVEQCISNADSLILAKRLPKYSGQLLRIIS